MQRAGEVLDLVALPLDHAAPAAGTREQIAAVAELSELMRCWFPALEAKNHADMKWKKFLCKQLCQREELFICKAPSCAVCVDRPLCFGPEES